MIVPAVVGGLAVLLLLLLLLAYRRRHTRTEPSKAVLERMKSIDAAHGQRGEMPMMHNPMFAPHAPLAYGQDGFGYQNPNSASAPYGSPQTTSFYALGQSSSDDGGSGSGGAGAYAVSNGATYALASNSEAPTYGQSFYALGPLGGAGGNESESEPQFAHYYSATTTDGPEGERYEIPTFTANYYVPPTVQARGASTDAAAVSHEYARGAAFLRYEVPVANPYALAGDVSGGEYQIPYSGPEYATATSTNGSIYMQPNAAQSDLYALDTMHMYSVGDSAGRGGGGMVSARTSQGYIDVDVAEEGQYALASDHSAYAVPHAGKSSVNV